MNRIVFLICMCFLSMSTTLAAGKKEVSGWTVRWSDMSLNGDIYSTISKQIQVPNIGNMVNIDASIQKDIDNLVSPSVWLNKYDHVKPCKSTVESEIVIIKVNQQAIKSELTERVLPNCDINFIFNPTSDKAKAFVRSEFDKGIFRFQFDRLDIFFDTRANDIAYREMKKEVSKEKQISGNAL